MNTTSRADFAFSDRRRSHFVQAGTDRRGIANGVVGRPRRKRATCPLHAVWNTVVGSVLGATAPAIPSQVGVAKVTVPEL
ncbi:hypothetical protein [Actinomadura geliboluensis]|uniref:Uncharacterized protein n=1 Tax=Actinomadura geliboluensis TaxID=882440 RepID=A0A5S4G6I3_9ACTN|nr:hypothetical protein [Actinomadura geliboluensis]TMR28452.1 hypothetical protein ETD96_37450 [Actinomadura geliboluensis]